MSCDKPIISKKGPLAYCQDTGRGSEGRSDRKAQRQGCVYLQEPGGSRTCQKKESPLPCPGDRDQGRGL